MVYGTRGEAEAGGSPEATANRAPSPDRLRAANEQLTLATLRAHEQADESAGRYRDLVEGLDAIVWEANAEPWQFTFLSQRAQTMFGYPLERWLAEPNFLRALIHADDRPTVARSMPGRRAAPEISGWNFGLWPPTAELSGWP